MRWVHCGWWTGSNSWVQGITTTSTIRRIYGHGCEPLLFVVSAPVIVLALTPLELLLYFYLYTVCMLCASMRRASLSCGHGDVLHTTAIEHCFEHLHLFSQMYRIVGCFRKCTGSSFSTVQCGGILYGKLLKKKQMIIQLFAGGLDLCIGVYTAGSIRTQFSPDHMFDAGEHTRMSVAPTASTASAAAATTAPAAVESSGSTSSTATVGMAGVWDGASVRR